MFELVVQNQRLVSNLTEGQQLSLIDKQYNIGSGGLRPNDLERLLYRVFIREASRPTGAHDVEARNQYGKNQQCLNPARERTPFPPLPPQPADRHPGQREQKGHHEHIQIVEIVATTYLHAGGDP